MHAEVRRRPRMPLPTSPPHGHDEYLAFHHVWRRSETWRECEIPVPVYVLVGNKDRFMFMGVHNNKAHVNHINTESST